MAHTDVAFDRVRHMARVPVKLAGRQHRFLLDTGIGVTVVFHRAFAGRHGLRETGRTFSGPRTSGQEITISPGVQLPEMAVGGYQASDQQACVIDLGDVERTGRVRGHHRSRLLRALRDHDRPGHDDPDRASGRRSTHQGLPGALDPHRDGPAVSAFANLVLPNGREIRVEVDTGSTT